MDLNKNLHYVGNKLMSCSVKTVIFVQKSDYTKKRAHFASIVFDTISTSVQVTHKQPSTLCHIATSQKPIINNQ